MALGRLLVFVAAVTVYLNTLPNGLLFDDEGAITDNADVTNMSAPLTDLLKNDFWGTPMTSSRSHKSWRPLTVLTYRMNYAIHGLDVEGYHAVNVLLHALASLIFVDVCDILFTPNELSVAAGLLFAVHPIHTEAVAGAVGRAEELAGIFLMLSFLAYVKACGSRSRCSMFALTLLSYAFVFVSLICKETGIAAIGVNTGYDCYLAFYRMYPGMKADDTDKKSKSGKNAKEENKSKPETSNASYEYGNVALRIFLSTIVGGVFVAARLAAGSSPTFPYNSNPMAFADSLQTRALSRAYIWFLNLYLLCVPSSLCADWSSGAVALVESPSDPRNLASLLMFVSVFALILYILPLSSSVAPRAKLVPYMGLVFLAVTFLPASSLIIPVGMVIGERVLYMPSMGFVILLVWLGNALFSRKGVRWMKPVVFWVLFFAYSTKTVHRNFEWHNPRTLFGSGVKVNPGNSKLWLFLSTTSKGDKTKGYGPLSVEVHESYLRNAIELEKPLRKSMWADPWFDLGMLLSEQERLEESDAIFSAGLQRENSDARGMLQYGRLLRKMGRKKESASYLNRVLQKEPDNAVALSNLAQVIGAKDLQKVEELLQHAMRVQPTVAEYAGNAAALLAMNGQPAKAVPYFEKAAELEKEDGTRTFTKMMWQACLDSGQLEKAKAALAVEIDFDPGDANSYIGMGMVHTQMHKFSESRVWFNKAIKLAPDDQNVAGTYNYFMKVMKQEEAKASGAGAGKRQQTNAKAQVKPQQQKSQQAPQSAPKKKKKKKKKVSL